MSVLCNLKDRRAATSDTEREPVLTVGNATYEGNTPGLASTSPNVVDQLAPASRYRAAGN